MGERLCVAGIVALVLSICANLLAGTIADPDLWGHVLFGKLTLALGGVSRIDPYAYASSGTWINHEWLAEVIFGGVFDLAGGTGLVLLKTGLGLALLAWIYRRLVRAGLDVLRAAAVLLLAALPFFVVLGSLRPHVFTFLLFAATLVVLREAEEDARRLWWLAPIMALWVNLHGGFLAGLGVSGVWIAVAVVGSLAGGRSREVRAEQGGRSRPVEAAGMLGALLVACAATLINPYGPDLPAFLLETATIPRPYIAEWQPLRLTGSLGGVYLLLAGWGGFTLWRAASRPPLPRLAVLAVTVLVPFVAVRHLPLFALAVVLLLDDVAVEAWGGSSPGRIGVLARGGWVRTGTTVVTVLLASVALFRSGDAFDCISVKFSDEVQYPARAVALLDAADVDAKLATFFNWGEYAIWHLGPELQVGMDGRRETVYPDSTYRSYLRFIGGSRDWSAYLEIGPADLALVPPDKPAYSLLELSDGWRRVYSDSVAGLFGRPGTAVTERVAATPAPDVPADGTGLCFPGPVESKDE